MVMQSGSIFAAKDIIGFSPVEEDMPDVCPLQLGLSILMETNGVAVRTSKKGTSMQSLRRRRLEFVKLLKCGIKPINFLFYFSLVTTVNVSFLEIDDHSLQTAEILKESAKESRMLAEEKQLCFCIFTGRNLI